MVLFPGGSVAAYKSLPVLRVHAGGTVQAILLQRKALSFCVHWQGSSVVCVGPDCPLCSISSPRQIFWICAKPIIASKFGAVSLLEMSASSEGRLQGLLKMEGISDTLGLHVEMSRKRQNSPLVVVPIVGEIEPVRDVAIEATLDAVTVLLKLPMRLPEEDAAAWAERVRPLLSRLAANAAGG